MSTDIQPPNENKGSPPGRVIFGVLGFVGGFCLTAILLRIYLPFERFVYASMLFLHGGEWKATYRMREVYGIGSGITLIGLYIVSGIFVRIRGKKATWYAFLLGTIVAVGPHVLLVIIGMGS